MLMFQVRGKSPKLLDCLQSPHLVKWSLIWVNLSSSVAASLHFSWYFQNNSLSRKCVMDIRRLMIILPPICLRPDNQIWSSLLHQNLLLLIKCILIIRAHWQCVSFRMFKDQSAMLLLDIETLSLVVAMNNWY